MDVQHGGETLHVSVQQYRNNRRLALRLVTEDGAPYATATVNVPDVALDPHEVILDPELGRSMVDALHNAGWIESSGRYAQVGHMLGVVAALTPAALDLVGQVYPKDAAHYRSLAVADTGRPEVIAADPGKAAGDYYLSQRKGDAVLLLYGPLPSYGAAAEPRVKQAVQDVAVWMGSAPELVVARLPAEHPAPTRGRLNDLVERVLRERGAAPAESHAEEASMAM